MRFEVLGAIRAMDDERTLVRLSAMRRKLLAVLLVQANRPISADALVDAVWGMRPPVSPDKSLHVHVLRLRRVLDRPDRLAATAGGYLLEVGPDELDAFEFTRIHDAARSAAEGGHPAEAAHLFREALALWRGEPYADIDVPHLVEPQVRRLAESRMMALEELYDAELATGKGREIVPELTELVDRFPLRERFVAQLMRALYRSGRQTRALTAYKAARRRLAESLHTEPGKELRKLLEAIQAEDPSLLPRSQPPDRQTIGAPVPPTPSQLPPAPGAFTGREHELGELERAADLADGRDNTGVVILAGMAGVGKTALAVRFGHLAADRFGDGQLYIDLQGHSTRPAMEPIIALGHLMRGLGADPARMPATVAEATAAYRSLVSGRKVLVVLDNAANPEQVRPLLPASPGCLTLITSRNLLSGLVAGEGASRVRLGVLAREVARSLLSRILGEQRVRAESDAVDALITACGGLPLALRIAAAQIADEPHREVAAYVAELGGGRLAALALHDDEQSAVGPAFEQSYQRLGSALGRLFRLLGLLPGPDFGPGAAAAVGGIDVVEARSGLRRLAASHLIEEPARGRYRFHDLLREFARQRAEAEEDPAEREAAMERLLTWYATGRRVAMAAAGSRRRVPDPPEPPGGVPGVDVADSSGSATAWLRTEYPNILAAARAATGEQLGQWRWRLLSGLPVLMADHGYLPDSLASVNESLEAARAAGDRQGIAHMLTELVALDYMSGMPVSDDVMAEALEYADRHGGHHGIGAYCLNLAGVIRLSNGDCDLAATYMERALEAYRDAGDVGGQSLVLNNLGSVYMIRGDLRRTEGCWAQVLSLLGDQVTTATANAAANLAWVRMAVGHTDGIEQVIEAAERALDEFGDGATAAQAAGPMSEVYCELGRYERAVDAATLAIQVGDTLDQPRLQVEPRLRLGWIRLRLDDDDAARVQFETVARIVNSASLPVFRPLAHRGLAETALVVGDTAAALEHARDCVRIAAAGNPLEHAHGLGTLAKAELAAGSIDDAIERAEQALTLHDKTGHYLGRARALRVLGEARLARCGDNDREDAERVLQEALGMFERFGSPEAAEVAQLVAGLVEGSHRGGFAPEIRNESSTM